MSGETESNVSGWTVDTLRVHFEQQFSDLKVLLDERYDTQTTATAEAKTSQVTAMNTALAAADKAVGIAQANQKENTLKAETAADKRFELLNELRAGVASTGELESLEKIVNSISLRVESIASSEISRQAEAARRQRFDTLLVSVVGAILAALTIVLFVVTK